jgi:sporulation protein YlmC with PRC-barrel domain
MRELKLVRMFGALVLLASAPVLGAVAVYAQKSPTEEQSSPSSPAPGAPKGAVDQPSAPGGSATETPSAPGKKPGDVTSPGGITPMTPSMTTPPAGGAPGKGAALDAKPVPGLGVMTADGQKVGEVTAVKAAPDGKVESIQVKTGGMLGFGGRTVNIPPTKFTVAGQNVQLSMTSAEVSKLPAVETPQG